MVNGVLIDFDGVISRSSVKNTIIFTHEYINKVQPIPYKFIENYIKLILSFPVESSVALLFDSLGLSSLIKDFYSRFNDLDLDSSRIVIDEEFYQLISFLEKNKLDYRILSLASKDRIKNIRNIDYSKIANVGKSKADARAFSDFIKDMNFFDWVQLDDSPIALRTGKLSGLTTVMMLNDIFTVADYRPFQQFIDYKTSSLTGFLKILKKLHIKKNNVL